MALGQTLYFVPFDGSHGFEVWKSDGTDAGTTMVKDINPGAADSSPNSLAVVGQTLFFRATEGTNGLELWRSDGTAAGTTLVKDIQPGSGGSVPNSLTALGQTLYFTADDGTHGNELWESDGTAAGTALVADIEPGSGDSGPFPLTPVGQTLFFAASDSTNGRELWKTAPTTTGGSGVAPATPGVPSPAASPASPASTAAGPTAPAGCIDRTPPRLARGRQGQADPSLGASARRGQRPRVRRARSCGARPTAVAIGLRLCHVGLCRFLQADGTFGPAVSCLRTHYIAAKGASRWSLAIAVKLPKGRYIAWTRAYDVANNVERKDRRRNLARFVVRGH